VYVKHRIDMRGFVINGSISTSVSTGSLAADRLRAQIPALHRTINGFSPVYLDAPGGTQMPQAVIDAISGYVVNGMANRRGTSVTSVETDAVIYRTRDQVAALVGSSEHVIVFGQNMTSLAISLGTAMGRDWDPGRRSRVVVSEIDHHANIDPWLQVAEDRGMDIGWIPVVPDELRLDLSRLDEVIDEQTQIVAVSLASNVVGTINDVATICRRAREVGAISVVDAVHGAPHVPMDVDAWGADVLFFSAHKFYGPHLGVMAIRRELLEKIRFYKVAKTLGNEYMAETGTQNHEAIAGLGATFDLLESLVPGATARERLTGAVRELAEYDDALADRLVEGLSSIRNVRIRRAPDPFPKTATVAFTATGRHPRDIGEACSAQAVFVTDGEVYSNTLATLTGVSMRGGWVRAGLAPYLTVDDVDRGIAVIEAAVRRTS
jgi:cysteine desulfurase family protein (TIGR01976 family)